MSPQVKVTIGHRVPFYDVDAMQIVWHGNYLKYFEIAREELSRRSGLDIYTYPEKNGFVFPVIRSTVKHVHPLRFGDDFTCTATLVESRVNIVLDFEIRLAASGQICARGQTEQVALRYPEMILELEIPHHVREALRSLAE